MNIVRMAFLQARASDLHELSLRVKLLNGAAAGIAHAGPQAADHLEHGIGQSALIRHPALYALGNQFFVVALEIAVLAAVSHSGQAAHAAVDLKLAALVNLAVAGGFLAAGNHRTDHNHVGAGGQGLDDIAAVLDAAVGNHRDAIFQKPRRRRHKPL